MKSAASSKRTCGLITIGLPPENHTSGTEDPVIERHALAVARARTVAREECDDMTIKTDASRSSRRHKRFRLNSGGPSVLSLLRYLHVTHRFTVVHLC